MKSIKNKYNFRGRFLFHLVTLYLHTFRLGTTGFNKSIVQLKVWSACLNMV